MTTPLTDCVMLANVLVGASRSSSTATAAQALGMAIAEVEVLCTDVVDTGMIERARMP